MNKKMQAILEIHDLKETNIYIFKMNLFKMMILDCHYRVSVVEFTEPIVKGQKKIEVQENDDLPPEIQNLKPVVEVTYYKECQEGLKPNIQGLINNYVKKHLGYQEIYFSEKTLGYSDPYFHLLCDSAQEKGFSEIISY